MVNKGGNLCNLGNKCLGAKLKLIWTVLFSTLYQHLTVDCWYLESQSVYKLFAINPFPHIDAFWCLCCRQLFENIVTKEEIAQNQQFLFLTLFFTFSHRFSIQLKRFSIFWQNMFKVVCCRFVVWAKGLNGRSNIFNKVENIEEKSWKLLIMTYFSFCHTTMFSKMSAA